MCFVFLFLKILACLFVWRILSMIRVFHKLPKCQFLFHGSVLLGSEPDSYCLAVCILLDSLILRAFIISRISTGILFRVIKCTIMYLCVVTEAVLASVVYEFHHLPSKFKIIVVTYNVHLYLTMQWLFLELPQTAICPCTFACSEVCNIMYLNRSLAICMAVSFASTVSLWANESIALF